VREGVKLIALRCAGYNNVDIEYAYNKIHVVRVLAYSPYAVAEHAMALLLTSIRRIHKAYIRTKGFNFSLEGLTGFDLHGKTVGVVGTGKIGRIFIDICRGFGMNVIAYDKFPAKDSGIEYVELDELWERSDIISLHCPLIRRSRISGSSSIRIRASMRSVTSARISRIAIRSTGRSVSEEDMHFSQKKNISIVNIILHPRFDILLLIIIKYSV